MKQTKTYQALIEAMKAGKFEDQKQVNYLFKMLNNGTEEQKEEIKSFFRSPDFDGFELAPEHSETGRKWLVDLWKTPTGAERKNNPFGHREQYALEYFDRCTLKGYYDAGNYHRSYYIPLWDVYATDCYGFEYYVNGGQIHITG